MTYCCARRCPQQQCWCTISVLPEIVILCVYSSEHRSSRAQASDSLIPHAGWGFSRQSLSKSGALAALFVGCGTLGCSLRFGATLIAFFLSSSKLTQYKEEVKEGLEEGGSKKGGQRNWKQVRRLERRLQWGGRAMDGERTLRIGFLKYCYC